MAINIIDDKHTPEMQKVMQEYNLSIDRELYYSVKDVVEGREIIPVTVGYLSEKSNRSYIVSAFIGKSVDYSKD